MKFFKYIALAVLASTISANAVQTQTVGKLKKNDTVVIAVDDLIDETELNAALATYATKTWAATTATNAANHAASSKVTKVTNATSGNVVKFASNGEVADSNLKVDDLLTTASLTAYAKKDEMKVEAVTGDTTKKKITLKNGLSQEVLVAHQSLDDYVTQSSFRDHAEDSTIHVTEVDQNKWNTAASNFEEHAADDEIHITNEERADWDAKYDLPDGGIPKADLAQAVQTSLGKADNAVQKQTLTALTDNDDIDTLYARVNQIIKVLKNETVTP